MIKVNELFAGIGAFRKALERLNIPHEIVGISEIDKYAIKSYEAIYGATRNYGDISKVAKLDYADLWVYGFPCQDISQAGHQAGIIKGETRSGLLYEVEHGELPKYLILENVKNLVGKKFIKQFEAWLSWLDELGYNSYWQVSMRKTAVFLKIESEYLRSVFVRALITDSLFLNLKLSNALWNIFLKKMSRRNTFFQMLS